MIDVHKKLKKISNRYRTELACWDEEDRLERPSYFDIGGCHEVDWVVWVE